MAWCFSLFDTIDDAIHLIHLVHDGAMSQLDGLQLVTQCLVEHRLADAQVFQ
jgi:hypothetical protein